eukprot:2604930-Pleurochrysis_carterae.AAC.2
MSDNGVDASQQSWDHTWSEFLTYAQRGDRGETAQENVTINRGGDEINARESYPTLCPGEVVGREEIGVITGHWGRNMAQFTKRARDNKHKQERKGETHRDKKARLAKGAKGTRIEDTAARRLLGGRDGRGKYRMFKDDTKELAHEEEYAEHPILRLFTRPEEMEKGPHKNITTESRHMNGADGKKHTHETLLVAMSLHEMHDFHLAVATDGAKKGGSKDRTETHRLSETTYGVWQGPESAKILREERRNATTL